MPKKVHKKKKIKLMQLVPMVPYKMSTKGRDIPLPSTHTKAMQDKKTAVKNNPKPGPYEY